MDRRVPTGWKDSELGNQISHLQVQLDRGFYSLEMMTITISPTSTSTKKISLVFNLFFCLLFSPQHRTQEQSCFLFCSRKLCHYLHLFIWKDGRF